MWTHKSRPACHVAHITHRIMARVKLTEFRTKTLLLGDAYRGIPVVLESRMHKLPARGRFVVKVDQGVKGRLKKKLLLLNQNARALSRSLATLRKKGFSRFLIEPFIPHTPDAERYLSLERVRGGIRILYAPQGGIDVETHPDNVRSYTAATERDLDAVAKQTGIPTSFLSHAWKVMDQHFLSFLEMNPLVLAPSGPLPLDTAALADSAGMFFARNAWGEDDIVSAATKHPAEQHTALLEKTSPASFKLTVMNPNGSLFFLLSGGGGSIVIADQAALNGRGKEIGNYGEYSGGPTRQETYLYTKEVLALMLASRKNKKALVIAGGVANFTDVKETFSGIIDALQEFAPRLRAQHIKIFVRRGGPHETEGLSLMKSFLRREHMFGAVYGSDAVITKAVDDAVRFIS